MTAYTVNFIINGWYDFNIIVASSEKEALEIAKATNKNGSNFHIGE